jgi:hypothetical protein
LVKICNGDVNGLRKYKLFNFVTLNNNWVTFTYRKVLWCRNSAGTRSLARVFGYSVTKSLKGVDHESNPGAGGISLFCRFRASGAAILVALAVLGTMPAVSAAEIVVFTAASLKEALDDAVRVYDNQAATP